MGEPRLALIIPTCGRSHDLAACLRSIERGAGPELSQLIVVDDAPEAPADVPAKIAGAPVRIRRNSEPLGAAACRNRALEMLDPEIEVIGFLDDDVRLPPEWFAVARAELIPTRGAITGPIRGFDKDLVSRARQLRYDARYHPLQPRQEVDFLAGGNAVIWRHTLVRAGAFQEVATMSDTLLARRLGELGTPCHFVPDLIALHRNSKGSTQACVAAWQAGTVEGRRRATTYGRRLASGAREALLSPDPAAAALNVALDAVFLTAHAMTRASSATERPALVPPPIVESAVE